MSSADILGQLMEKPAEFAPSTFAQRGVAVDFTTPLLVQSRIRQSDGDRVELILPNLAGGKGSYILAWRSLVQFATVTLHDHALYDAVLAIERMDPATVRTATLSVAAKGLAGRDAMRRAQTLLAQEKEEALLTNFLLVVDLLKLAGISAQELMTGRTGEDTEARMKRAIFQVAHTLQISPEVLYQRIEVLTRSTFTVGLPWAPTPGRLRRLLGDLDAFAESLTQWQSRDVTAAAEVGRFAAAVAVHTTTLARLTMGESDGLIRNVLSIMRNWERDAKIISGQMSTAGVAARRLVLYRGALDLGRERTARTPARHDPGDGPADPGDAEGDLGMDRQRAGSGIEIHPAQMGPLEPGLADW